MRNEAEDYWNAYLEVRGGSEDTDYMEAFQPTHFCFDYEDALLLKFEDGSVYDSQSGEAYSAESFAKIAGQVKTSDCSDWFERGDRVF